MFSGGTAAPRSRATSDLRRLLCRATAALSTTATASSAAGGGGREGPARPAGPPPIRVALTETAGRGVFATRRIAAGEVIHSAKPLLTHPSTSLLQKVCYLCLRRLGKEALPSSGGVETAASDVGSCYFCSESCREQSKVFLEVEKRTDWSLFNDHCRVQGLKYPFMVKRLACMVISRASSAESLHILQPANLLPEAHHEIEEEFKLLKYAFMRAQFEDELLAFLTKQWYINVLARIRINAFRIESVRGSYEDLLTSAANSVAVDAAVGNAVYMLPSFYNHDCDPNTHVVWIENADAKLKALCDIEAGEELRICYIDASMDCEARQKILAEGFGFECRCLRCLSGD